jgi:hypothetical protein
MRIGHRVSREVRGPKYGTTSLNCQIDSGAEDPSWYANLDLDVILFLGRVVLRILPVYILYSALESQGSTWNSDEFLKLNKLGHAWGCLPT